MQNRLNQSVISIPASGIRRVAEAAKAVEGCISLTLGEPGFDTPPEIVGRAKRALDEGATHYPPNAGLMQLREEIAAGEATRFGGTLTADQVLVTCGSTESLACALFAILEPGDEVIVPSPAFGLYGQQIQLARGVHVPMDTAPSDFQIDPDALSALITPRTKAILLNSPCNPTGVMLTRASIEAAEAVCLQHDLFLIFDAVYDRLAFVDDVPAPSAARLGERLIWCSAFSKTYAMTGWRIGFVLAAPQVMASMLKVHAALVVGVSTFSQLACHGIYAVDTHAMRDTYRAHRDLVVRRIADMGLPLVRPEGAFYAFPSIAPLGLDDETFVMRMLQEARVAVVPGTCFGAPGHIRLSYCCTTQALEEGLSRMAQFLQTL